MPTGELNGFMQGNSATSNVLYYTPAEAKAENKSPGSFYTALKKIKGVTLSMEKPAGFNGEAIKVDIRNFNLNNVELFDIPKHNPSALEWAERTSKVRTIQGKLRKFPNIKRAINYARKVVWPKNNELQPTPVKVIDQHGNEANTVKLKAMATAIDISEGKVDNTLEEKYFSTNIIPGITTTTSLLNNIIAQTDNPQVANLAQLLLDLRVPDSTVFLGEMDPTVQGDYDPRNGNITINKNAKFFFEPELSMMHEIIHAHSHAMLQSGSPEAELFNRFFEEAKARLIANGVDPNYYALTNADEFLTGIFTNKEFMELLSNSEAVRDRESLWEDIKDIIRRLLGIDADEDFTLLEDDMEAGLGVLKVSSSFNQRDEGEYLVEAYSDGDRTLDMPGVATNAADFSSIQKEIDNRIQATQKEIAGTKEIPNEELKGKAKLAGDFSGKTSRYVTVDGKVIGNRVSDTQTANFRKRLGVTEAKAMNESDVAAIKRKIGTRGHHILQQVLEELMRNDGDIDNVGIMEAYPTNFDSEQIEILKKTAFGVYKEIMKMQNKIDPMGKPVIYPENIFYDKTKDLAGTGDVVAVFSDGRASIFDYKFISLPMSWEGQNYTHYSTEITAAKEESYEQQISEYKRMLKQIYGVKEFIHSRVVVVNTQYNVTQDGNMTDDVFLLESFATTDEDVMRLQPVAREYTEDEGVNQLLETLYQRKARLTRTISENYGDAEKEEAELYEVNEAIKAILLTGDITKLVEDVVAVSDLVEDALGQPKKLGDKENPEYPDLGTLREYLEIMRMYNNLSVQTKDYMKALKTSDPDRHAELEELVNKAISSVSIREYSILEELKNREFELAQERGFTGENYNVTMKGLNLGQRWMTYLSDYKHPVMRLFRTLVNDITDNRRRDFNALKEKFNKLHNDLMEWGKSQGKKNIEVFDYLMNEKGNLVGKFTKDYWKEFNDAVERQDIEWFKERFHRPEGSEEDKRFKERRDRYFTTLEKRYAHRGEEYIDSRKNMWLRKNDINYNDGDNRAWLNKRAVKALKNPEEYYSKEYQFIQDTPALRAYYEAYIDFNEQANDFLDVQINRSFIPNVQKSLVQSFIDSGGSSLFSKEGRKMMKESYLRSLQVRDIDDSMGIIDPETGEMISRIPILFTDPVRDTLGDIDLSLKSRDLTTNLMLFAETAYNYKYAKEHEEAALMLKELVQQKDFYLTDYFGRITGDIRKGDKVTLDTLDGFIKYYFYGQRIQSKDKAIKLGEKRYSMNRIVREAVTFYSKKSLGWNFRSAIGGWLGALGNAVMTGAEGVYYTRRKYVNAMWNGVKRDPKYIAASALFELSQENVSMEKAYEMSAINIKKRLAKDVSFFLQRVTDDSIDNQVLNAMMDSYAFDPNSGKAQRIEKLQKMYPGKDIKSMLETSEMNQENQRLQLFDMEGNEMTEAMFNDFRRKVKYVASTGKGNMSEEDIALYKTALTGMLLGQHKSWLPRMFRTRWMPDGYNYELDEIEMGRHRVFIGEIFAKGMLPAFTKFIQFAADYGAGTLGLRTNFLKIDRAHAEIRFQQFLKENPGIVAATSEEEKLRMLAEDPNRKVVTLDEFIEMTRAQIRATAAEVRAYMLLAAAYFAIGFDWDEDDRRRRPFMRKLSEYVAKAKLEIGFFIPVIGYKEMLQIATRNPAPAVNLVADVAKLVSNTVGEAKDTLVGVESDERYEITSGKVVKDRSPKGFYAVKMMPNVNNIERFLEIFGDSEDKTSFWEGFLSGDPVVK
jgi:hypothetical protein